MSDTFHRPKKNEDYKNKLTVTCYLNKINCIKRASKLHKRITDAQLTSYCMCSTLQQVDQAIEAFVAVNKKN